MTELRKRLPAMEKPISEIEPDKDVRVRIMGTVIDCVQNSLVIDDGTGKVEVVFDQDIGFVRNGQFVRAITRILPLMDGFECRGEAVQVLNNFDINLYRQVKEITGD